VDAEAFRRGNEAIAEVARRRNAREAEIDFVCECADSECFGRVPLTLADYELTRSRGERVRLPEQAPTE
jgi:hypothetical protein